MVRTTCPTWHDVIHLRHGCYQLPAFPARVLVTYQHRLPQCCPLFTPIIVGRTHRLPDTWRLHLWYSVRHTPAPYAYVPHRTDAALRLVRRPAPLLWPLLPHVASLCRCLRYLPCVAPYAVGVTAASSAVHVPCPTFVTHAARVMYGVPAGKPNSVTDRPPLAAAIAANDTWAVVPE